MISCEKGVCEISGTTNEINADLTVMIHAIDLLYSEKMGKEKAFEHIKNCYDTAMKNRDIKPDNEAELELLHALKRVNDLIDSITKEAKNNGSAE